MTNNNDYPTTYEDAKAIKDVNDWLESREPEEIKKDMKNLHVYQLEWLGYKVEDQNKKEVIRNEIQERGSGDLEAFYNTYSNQSSSSTGGTRKDVWDSGLEIIDSFKQLAQKKIGASTLEEYAKNELGIQTNKVVLSEEVRKTCIAIQEEINDEYGGGCEFGVLFKGEWTDKGFVVKPDYVIPEQTVSKAHIDYDEDLKKYRDEGYIVNIHSHPWAGESSGFSGTDDSHINSHFDMAVLYAGGAETFADAVANVELDEGSTVRISPQVQVESPERELPDIDGMENVETKSKRTRTRKTTTRKSTAPKGSYERYKNNFTQQALPDSPEETDSEQQIFNEVYNLDTAGRSK